MAVVHPSPAMALRQFSRQGLASLTPGSSSSRRRLQLAVKAQLKQEVLWATAPIREVSPAAEQLYHIVLDIGTNPELKRGHSTPGQFVQIKVGDAKPVFLAIASPPATAAKGRLEFLVKEVEGTASSLLCGMTKGDNVEVSQVMGNGFKVEEVYPCETYQTVLLFATGSGISPIRSLLESGIDAAKRSDVRLFYGVRSLQRLPYKDKLEEWKQQRVNIVPVLSQPDEKWTGESGYVQAAFARSKDDLELDATRTGAFLCGHKEMTKEVTDLLVAQGVPREKILMNF